MYLQTIKNIVISGIIFTCAMGSATEKTVLKIPQAAKPLTLHQSFAHEAWRNAAIIERFNAVGMRERIPQKTKFYIQHDWKNLWVLAVLSEEKSSIRAFKRSYGENLTLDSAVAVVIGQGAERLSEARGFGYDDSYVASPQVKHFYEFAVNAAGSQMRSYNEGYLELPLFESKVKIEQNEWLCLMKIPFESAGLEATPDKLYFINLFRFLDSLRYGFYLPAFGGYRKLDFVRFELLPLDRNKEASRISADLKLPIQQPGRHAFDFAVSELPDTGEAKIVYYPLSRKVVATLPPGLPKTKAILRVGTKQVEETVRKDISTVLAIDVDYKENQDFSATLEYNGKTLTQKFTGLEMPEWYNTKAGIEYINEKVAYPWKKPELKNDEVILAHGSFQLGDSVLPEQINIKGNSILNSPITIYGELADGSVVPVNRRNELISGPVAVEAISNNASGIEIKNRVEFDGFSIIRMRLQNIDVKQLAKLELRIPLKKGIAQFVNRRSCQYLALIGQHGYSAASNNEDLWVGNENTGIAFSYDRDCFYSSQTGRQIEFLKDSAMLVIRFVDAPGQVTDNNTVFQFFIQPTPVRGDFIPPLADRLALGAFERWSDFQGFPDLSKIPQLKSAAHHYHQQNKFFYVYFSNLLASDSPGYQKYRDDLEAPPRRMWYRRSYNPGKGVDCFVTCLRKYRGEQVLDGVEKIVESANIDGVYLDGPTVPFSCLNPAHKCADGIPALWNDDYNEGRVLGQRRFLQRLRGIFDSRGKHNPLWVHTGGGINIATLGFADFYFEGEQLHRYRDGYLLEPEKMRLIYSGGILGIRGIFLPILYFDSTFTTRQSLPWALVNGTETATPGKEHPCEKLFFSFLREQNPATFYPYYKEQPHLKIIKGEKAYISYLRNKHEALIIASNLRINSGVEVELDLSGFFPDKKVEVRCVSNTNAFEQNGSKIKFNLPSSEMRMFYLSDGEPSAREIPSPERPLGRQERITDFSEINKFDPENWDLPEACKIRQDTLTIDGDFKATQIMELNKPLPEEFTAKFSLIHSGKFEFYIDEVKITFSPAAGWLIYGIDEFENSDYCENSHMGHRGSYFLLNKKIDCSIVMKDNRLYILYDNSQIIRHGLPAIDNRNHKLKFSVEPGNSITIGDLKIYAGADGRFVPETVHPILK